MNILIVSQCEKRALTETRRIVDQFAERRGDRTWQTSITQAGLDTLRKMLKKTARKNTAVACHWIRGHDHSELSWIVGNAGRFNELGTVPTNTTEADILRSKDENTWHCLEDIKLLAVLASLFHDFGKASRAFQTKLQAAKPVADAYRHEWVSLRLFEAFVGVSSDVEWLTKLALGDGKLGKSAVERLVCDHRGIAPFPFATANGLPPLAQAIGWLIVSHHRLPTPDRETTTNPQTLKYLLTPVLPNWNGARSDALEGDKAACWEFPHGTPFDSRNWSRRAAACANEMLKRPGFINRGTVVLDDSFRMHMSRLILMLADHHYSSCPSEPRYGDASYPLYANTDRQTGAPKQRLDEHLAGVASHARRVVRALPRLERDLPRIARCKAFQKRTAVERFRWQDRAYDLATSLRDRSTEFGFFGVNMASTGCGKTLANGRVLYGLADVRRGARFTVALGLRTLTLQTGEAYRERLGLGDDDMAVLVGGAAVKELFELSREATDSRARYGSESAEDLLALGSHVNFEGNLEDGPLKRWLGSNSNANKLVQAPVLVCTIDHLMPATESLRGGSQIAPMLRLLSSDLVLDEPDDFDVADLPALSRLVHWSGLLGSRVVLSSATLPPALVEALYAAYSSGRQIHQNNRGETGRALAIPCAWFDEFRCETSTPVSREAFQQSHQQFVDRRLKQLRKESPRRAVELVPIELPPTKRREEVCSGVAALLPGLMTKLHDGHHTVDPIAEQRVSFGLVRFANIEPIIEIAQALYATNLPPDYMMHLCVYHARQPLLMRSATEVMLDGVLQRQDELAVFKHSAIRAALDSNAIRNHLFVVLASPVAEVGRDHDYDWAVVEPSSMRSVIQLGGRIRRHRQSPCKTSNIVLLRKNIRALYAPQNEVFCRPGFEQAKPPFRLKTRDLEQLLAPEQWSPLDAAPRITERSPLKTSENLVDLEHGVLRATLLGVGASANKFAAQHFWTTRAPLTGIIQKATPFRKSLGEEADFAFLPEPDDDDILDLKFHKYDSDGCRWTSAGAQHQELQLATALSVRPWGPSDYRAELLTLSERTGLEPRACAQRYGRVTLRLHEHGWEYHPVLGFKRCR